MQEGRNVESYSEASTKPSLRQHLGRKTFHAAGHCYANAAGGRCVIKMMSGHDGLAASGNDFDNGPDEKGGDNRC